MDVCSFCLRYTLVRDGGNVLRDSFDITPEYLSEDRGGERRGQVRLLSLRPDGHAPLQPLKLWMAFKFMGRNGYAETVERHLELTAICPSGSTSCRTLSVPVRSKTAVCCFVTYLSSASDGPEDQDRIQQALQQRVEKSGKAFLPLDDPAWAPRAESEH